MSKLITAVVLALILSAIASFVCKQYEHTALIVGAIAGLIIG